MGGVSRALGNPTLLFRGFELSYTLLILDTCMHESARFGELRLLISQLLAFTLQRPAGTSCFDPTKKRNDCFGEISSTIWTRELYFMARLCEEFPNAVSE
jgi:hypothetical protein